MISLFKIVILISLRYMVLAGVVVVDLEKTAMTKARMLASLKDQSVPTLWNAILAA
jgi:hypothetical protein